MRIPRFLKTIMALLVCIALIRSINNAGPISLMGIVAQLQSFDFDLDHVYELVSLFREGTLSDILYTWDYSLTGFEGFIFNVASSVSSFFIMLGTLLKVVVQSIWSLILNVINLFVQLLTLFADILGFNLPSGA